MQELLSPQEVAKILKVSDAAIRKRIRNKSIKAIKVGRGYVISRDEILRILGESIGEDSKREIDKAIEKAMGEYRDAFNRLAKE